MAEVNGAGAPALQSGYIRTLDGWRAIAIGLVILSHQYGLAHCMGDERLTCRLVTAGNPGVQLFFALSGFLICSRLLEERDISGKISLRNFYLRRAFRILPAALLYLTIVALLGTAGVLAVQRRELVASVLFARNYLPPEPGWYTTHFWSLAVEEHFYVVWPALLCIIPARRLGRFAIAAALTVALWRSIDARFHVSVAWFPAGVSFFRTDTRLDGLFAGCALAVALRDQRWRERAAHWLPFPVLCSLLAIFMVTRSVPAQVVIATLLVAGSVAAPAGFAGRALELPGLRWIGRLSYSLYLWQELFSVPPTYVAGVWHRLPLSVAPTIVFAWLSYRFVERPLLRFGHRLAPPVREGRPELAPQRAARAEAADGDVSLLSPGATGIASS